MNRLLVNARSLRRNQTSAEQRLWYNLRAHRFQGFKFRRQVPIGVYIVDFVCGERQLVVELDGGQHAERVAEDLRRDEWLRLEGYQVLRFWNSEVMGNLEGVLKTLSLALSRSAGEGNG